MKHSTLTPSLVLFVAALALAGLLPAQTADLGRIDFPTSGSPEAQKRFLRGVLLLHSFEYNDAREEFQKAQKLDPDFALAYWGEAMTCNHPVWFEQNREAARAALNRLAPTPEARLAKAPTQREKEYLRAVESLYGEGDKKSRDRAYAQAMRRLAEEYPDDLEAASFYALAVLGTSSEGRDIPTYMRAAAIVEEVFGKNPQHPGAVHYLVHSYDDPIHAPLGLRAARVYAKLAPAAVHAQHMPSHIFLALGMWEDVIASNEASWAAARKRGGEGSHSLHWLEYAYLQQGRYRDARKLLEIMKENVQKRDSMSGRWHLAAMRATYLIETRQWEDEAARMSVDTSGIAEISASAGNLFALGLAAVKRGNRAAAEKALAELKALREKAASGGREGHSHAEWYTQVWAPGVKAAEIMETELRALIRLAEGKSADAVRLLKDAAAAEAAMSFEFGPPIVAKPSHELLGELLLERKRPEEARQQFELALGRAPKRALSLLGLARAAARSGDPTTAQQTYTELRRIWQKADAGLMELEEVTRSLADAGRLR